MYRSARVRSAPRPRFLLVDRNNHGGGYPPRHAAETPLHAVETPIVGGSNRQTTRQASPVPPGRAVGRRSGGGSQWRRRELLRAAQARPSVGVADASPARGAGRRLFLRSVCMHAGAFAQELHFLHLCGLPEAVCASGGPWVAPLAGLARRSPRRGWALHPTGGLLRSQRGSGS